MIKWLLILALQQPQMVQRLLPHTFPRDTTKNYIVIHNDGMNIGIGPTRLYLNITGKSYHYFIARDGTITQLMTLEQIANHAGKTKWNGMEAFNYFSIGICLQGKDRTGYTSAQYRSLKSLIRYINARYPDSKTKPILKHSQVAWPRGRKSDPGSHFKIPK